MSSENSDPNRDQRLGLFIFDCFMSVMYLALGIILLFTPFVKKNWPMMPDCVISGLGALLGLYGIYRIARVTKRIIQKNS